LFLLVLGGEGHHAVFKFFDAAVCNGHPVGIACQEDIGVKSSFLTDLFVFPI
jgi:hypothetical protein